MQDQERQRGRILVVEDEGVVASDIEHCLVDSGFEVTGVADNAEDALLEASKHRPDLVLMDIRIQGALDGIEAGELLHQRFGLPVVYLTAHSDKDTIARAKTTQPLGFLLKPFKQAELTSAVDIALSRARAERELREREQSFFLALESIPDAVLSIDSEGALKFINHAAEALTAWTRQEALARPIAEIVHIVDEPRGATEAEFRALCDRASEQSGGDEMECRMRARSGSLHWVRIRVAAMQDVDSRPIRAVILQEITKQKETLLTLRRQADLLEQAHEPILTRELGGAITYWNRGSEMLYGFRRDQALGCVCSALLQTIHPLGAAEIESALERDGRWSGELLQTTQDGRQIVVESLMVSVAEPSGRTTVLETHRDVTERKRVEQELESRVRDRTAQLEAVNKELEAFAYSVSHDLRAPLRGIDGWSLALEEDCSAQLDPQALTHLQRVRTEAQRMGALIDDLLKLSQVTRAGMQSEQVDLTTLATNIAGRLREAERARALEFAIAPNMTAVGDTHLLDIALTNLLSNSVKFTAPRSPARIEFGRCAAQGEPAFYIRDNGVGFDMAYARTLFGAFQRLHRASEFPGTGIGLAIVQRVISRHGGSVWAESKPDQGATFYFTLAPPAAP